MPLILTCETPLVVFLAEARTLRMFAQRLAYRKGLTKKDAPDFGMSHASAAQTDLENAAQAVKLAREAMARAGCDAESLAQIDAVTASANIEVPALRKSLESLRPKPAMIIEPIEP